MSYLPNTDAERAKMLAAIGVNNIKDLFVHIPQEVQDAADFSSLTDSLDDMTLQRKLITMSSNAADLNSNACFLGAGIYDHYIPPVVGAVCNRSEFYTAYTPYQPEVSQGVLQSIYEFQSLITRLTGMDVSNASMYDGATALAEAVIMSCDLTKRRTVVLPANLHPSLRSVVETYLEPLGIAIRTAAQNPETGVTEIDTLTEDDACIVLQQPNFHGVIEDLGAAVAAAKLVGAQTVVSIDPMSLGILETPGALGVDIVVGEGQGLGCFPAFGGPLLGLFACKKEYIRRIPGRIVGGSVDTSGRRAYTMTLRTREQDIRRDTATSNICTNQALFALAATVYLSVMGKQGFHQAATLCLQKSHYLAAKLVEAGLTQRFSGPFFKEFVITCPAPVVDINKALLEKKMIGGLPLPDAPNDMLVCVTEQRTKEELDSFVDVLASFVKGEVA